MTEQEANQNSRREITKVEGNFIELFPVRFAQFKRRADAQTETVTKPRGAAVIRHNSRYFTAFDMDVMLAAFALACRHNQRCFPATLSDFARIMKITDCGKNLNAIRESLAELAATSATFNNVWYDCAGRTYKSETALSFIAYKLVGRKEITGGKLRSDEIRQLSWIEIPKHFYDSITNGYFRYIDADVYFSLPSGIARAAYLYFEKRLGVKEHYEEKTASALENIIKRPPTPKDIKNFKYRTIPKLSGAFRFDKKKLKKEMLAVSHRVLFYGAAATTAPVPEKVADAEKADAAALGRNTPRPFGPPRKKLTSHGEYVLERACIFCNRDDDYFKNVVKKYISILGADRVAGALGDTRDARPESNSKYFIHLLKNS